MTACLWWVGARLNRAADPVHATHLACVPRDSSAFSCSIATCSNLTDLIRLFAFCSSEFSAQPADPDYKSHTLVELLKRASARFAT
jgi:hypothetical protein